MLQSAMQKKIAWMLSLDGITPALLVQLTGVGGPTSVSEWKRTGRVAKPHLPVFARLTKTLPEYWLDDMAPIPPTPEWMAGAHQVREPGPGWVKYVLPIDGEAGPEEVVLFTQRLKALPPDRIRQLMPILEAVLGAAVPDDEVERRMPITREPPGSKRPRRTKTQ